jgi:hypothetical protein
MAVVEGPIIETVNFVDAHYEKGGQVFCNCPSFVIYFTSFKPQICTGICKRIVMVFVG